jgi:hypothetical protein
MMQGLFTNDIQADAVVLGSRFRSTMQLFSATVECLTSMLRSKPLSLLVDQLSVVQSLLQEFVNLHKGREHQLTPEVFRFPLFQ